MATPEALARGLRLGDSLDQVLGQESGTPYHNLTSRVLTYSYPISGRSSLYYNVYYTYDETRSLREISLSLEFDQRADKPGSFKTFEKMLTDIHNYLEVRFGEPETQITKTRAAGDEIYHRWQPADLPGVQILKVLYANPKYGIKRAIRVDFTQV